MEQENGVKRHIPVKWDEKEDSFIFTIIVPTEKAL